jgi:chromosome segregation ATPase
MASKYEVEEMLKKSIETNNKLTKHIEALWDEIGQKQTRVQELNWEIEELKEKRNDSLTKKDLTKRAQFQKDWLEHYNHRKIDN